jgi:hypothetical protein
MNTLPIPYKNKKIQTIQPIRDATPNRDAICPRNSMQQNALDPIIYPHPTLPSCLLKFCPLKSKNKVKKLGERLDFGVDAIR